MSSKKERIEQSKEYLNKFVDKWMNRLVVDLLKAKPENVLGFIQEWAENQIVLKNEGKVTSRGELITDGNVTPKPEIKQPIIEVADNQEPSRDDATPSKGGGGVTLGVPGGGSVTSDSDDESSEPDPEELEKKKKKAVTKGVRPSVSAEAFGMFNKKTAYQPKVIAKADDVKERIRTRLSQAFMFASLDEKEKNIVINAMEECNFSEGDTVIKQGDDGDRLFVVDTGNLTCQRRMKKEDAEDTYLKTYIPGEAFGELALLYNAPRAATIIAKTESQCFSLDRDCFNNIVKESAIKRRKRYDEFVQKIELLQELDAFERGKLTDAMVSETFRKDDYIVKEGEMGDKFYFIEEGTCIAVKENIEEQSSPLKKSKRDDGKEEFIVYEYQENDYFGELALLHEAPRKASIKVTSD